MVLSSFQGIQLSAAFLIKLFSPGIAGRWIRWIEMDGNGWKWMDGWVDGWMDGQ